jgi:site-specific recombinase XerD
MRITLAAVPRTARQLRNPLSGRDYASYSAISGKARHRRSCLSWNAVRRYRRQASPASSTGSHRACGYKLANDGHDTRAIQAYLGHRNIQNTTRYTALAPQRFKEFFRD